MSGSVAKRCAALVLLAWLCATPRCVFGAEASSKAATPIPIADVRRAGPVGFEAEVLPILAKNCLACHKSGSTETDLVLESPESIRKGDDHGPAVVPGKSGESRLLRQAAHLKEAPPAMTNDQWPMTNFRARTRVLSSL